MSEENTNEQTNDQNTDQTNNNQVTETQDNGISDEALLNMSDEEVMNMTEAPSSSGSKTEEVQSDKDENEEDNKDDKDDSEKDQTKKDEENQEKEDKDNPLNKPDDEQETEKDKGKKPSDKQKDEKEDKNKSSDETVEDKSKAQEQQQQTINYEEAFKKIVGTPIKAGGQNITLNSAEEAITLIQKGAHYTQRMQKLQPVLKLVKMLENNGLLNEEKLTHFIDVEKKDPAAIAKFLKDKQIDPLDLDMSEENNYKPGKHTVSDEEMRFDTVLKDVQSTATGRETIEVIDKQWDRTSQSRVFAEPEILKLIDVHRSSGIYEQITNEMERLKLLGVIPENTVFLDAYKSVGDELHKNGRLIVDGVPTNQVRKSDNQNKPEPKQTQQRQVIDTRSAKPNPAVRNSEAARAAAPTRTNTSKPNPADFNPLSMSDEEFEKQAGSFRI